MTPKDTDAASPYNDTKKENCFHGRKESGGHSLKFKNFDIRKVVYAILMRETFCTGRALLITKIENLKHEFIQRFKVARNSRLICMDVLK